MVDLVEPRRLLDPLSGASGDMRTLLGSASTDDDPHKMGRLADRLAPMLFVAPTLAAGVGASSAASASTAPAGAAAILKASVLTKVTIGVSASIVAAGVGVAGWHAVHHDAPMNSGSRSGPNPPQVERAPAIVPSDEEAPADEASVRLETSERRGYPVPSARSTRPTVDALPAEAELLARAQRLVRSDPSAALRVVRSHAVRFPRSRLAEEREVLMIEALSRLGRDDAARRRIQRFRARFPTSPYETRLAHLLDPER